jgi:hypothetical protein
VRQNALRIGDRGDDSRDDIILQLENRFRLERAIIGLSPEMSTGNCVHELDTDAQPGACLPQASFQHVTRAEFVSCGAHIDRSVSVAQGRTVRDNSEVRET